MDAQQEEQEGISTDVDVVGFYPFEEFPAVSYNHPQPPMSANPASFSSLSLIQSPSHLSYSYLPYGYGLSEIESSGDGDGDAIVSAVMSYLTSTSAAPTATSSSLVFSELSYETQTVDESTLTTLAPVSDPITTPVPVPPKTTKSVKAKTERKAKLAEAKPKPKMTEMCTSETPTRKLKMYEMDSDEKRVKNAKSAKANRDKRKEAMDKIRQENETLEAENAEMEKEYLRVTGNIRNMEIELASLRKKNNRRK